MDIMMGMMMVAILVKMCMKYEKSISDLVNVYEINYFSEKGEDKGSSIFSKISDKVRKFFLEMKMKVNTMIQSAKVKASLNNMKALIASTEATYNGVTVPNSKLSVEYSKKRLELFMLDSKKLILKSKHMDSAVFEAKFKKLCQDYEHDLEWTTSTKNSSSPKIPFKKAVKSVIKEFDEIESSISDVEKSMNSVLKEIHAAEMKGEVKGAVKAVEKISSLAFKTTQSFIHHPYTTMMSVMAVVSVGKAVSKTVSKTIKDAPNKRKERKNRKQEQRARAGKSYTQYTTYDSGGDGIIDVDYKELN